MKCDIQKITITCLRGDINAILSLSEEEQHQVKRMSFVQILLSNNTISVFHIFAGMGWKVL